MLSSIDETCLLEASVNVFLKIIFHWKFCIALIYIHLLLFLHYLEQVFSVSLGMIDVIFFINGQN